jgi:spore maturation protein CgeB
MSDRMKIAFFGSSLVSAYWNGAATYYRGIIRALAARGHQVTFYEPDAYERQKHRDIDDPPWAKVVVYSGTDPSDAERMLERAAKSSDVLVKASGVGVFDELLEARILDVRKRGQRVLFWDVDAPATLERVRNNPADPFRRCIPKYDFVFTYGGGDPVVREYEGFGARRCVPIYNALDPDTHHEVKRDSRFECDLALLANRLPDREARVEEFFFRPARALPDARFLLGGNGWEPHAVPSNVRCLGHVYTADHNALNCSAKAVLNVARDSMAKTGFSPATRVFEAAGAAACIVTDAWEGIELFLEPGSEILVADDGAAVAEHVARLTLERARAIGQAAKRRVLAQHTYAHRARHVEALLARDYPVVAASTP